MAKKKKITLTQKYKNLSKGRKIVFILLFVAIGTLIVGNSFARQTTDYKLDQPTELSVLSLSDNKPTVISKDSRGKVSYESRSKSVNITTEGMVYCTPEDNGQIKIARITSRQLSKLLDEVTRTGIDPKDTLQADEATVISNTKMLQVSLDNDPVKVATNRSKPSAKFKQIENTIQQLCKNAQEVIPDNAVPVFTPSSDVIEIDPPSTGFNLISKVSAGGEAPAGPQFNAAVEDDQIRLINHERKIRGIGLLGKSNCLTTAARKWSRHMALVNNLYHSQLQQSVESECGTGWWRKIGENVGKSQDSAGVFQAYMNSPGHRANILDNTFQRVGVGAAYYKHPSSSWTILWTTQLFAACQGSCANK